MAKKAAKKTPEREEEVVVLRQLTKAELAYITKMAGTETVEQIAEALDIEPELVITNMPVRTKRQSPMSNLIAKKREAVVMTPAASELADDTRSQRKNPKAGAHIYKPYAE